MNNKQINRLAIAFLFCIIFLASLSPAFSQMQRLTLEQAIDLAVQNNYDAKKARLAVQKSEAKIDEALGSALPKLTLNANYTNNPKKPKFFLPDFANPGSGELKAVEIGATNSFKAGAQLTQILFNSAVFTGIGTAKTFYKASKEQYKSSISKTIGSVKKTFYGVLLAKELVAVFDTILANANHNLYVAEKMYEEGFIPEFDLLRARTSVKNLEPELLNAQMNYMKLLNLFKFNIGIDVNENIEPAGSISLKEYKLPNTDSLIAKLKEANYDLRTLKYMENVQEEVIDIYRSDYYPSLILFGNYTYQGQSNDWDFKTVKSAAVGVNLSLTLFQGMQTKNRVQQAKVDYLTSVEQYNQTYEALKMKLKNAVYKLSLAKSKVEINEGNIARAKRGFHIAEIRYKEGTGSQVEINDANSALAKANLNYLRASYDYLEATIELEELLGKVPQKYINKFDNH